MPLPDVTIDTNVFMHACNPIEPRHADSVSFIHSMLSCTACLAIDPGFSIDPSQNTSLIGAEYLQKFVPGSLSATAIMHLALNGRVVVVSSSLKPQKTKKLNQLISNRRDRTFVKVAANSQSNHFVSHDYADFSEKKRKEIREEFGVKMVSALNCRPIL